MGFLRFSPYPGERSELVAVDFDAVAAVVGSVAVATVATLDFPGFSGFFQIFY